MARGARRDAWARAGCSAGPARAPRPDLAAGELHLPGVGVERASPTRRRSACLPASAPLRRSPKALLIELSKQLEREAMRLGETGVVAATFQEARHFTPSTAQRYRDLVERTGFVCALGEGLPVEPLPGRARRRPAARRRGARRVGRRRPRPALQRRAARPRPRGRRPGPASAPSSTPSPTTATTVVRAAHALLSRVAPRVGPAPARPSSVRRPVAGPGRPGAAPVDGDALLRDALSATTSGVTIADMRRPDQPLVYVNAAFEELAGFPQAEVLGRNCRFLQSPDTDPAAVARIRAAIDRGEECRETVLQPARPRPDAVVERDPPVAGGRRRRHGRPATSASSTTSPRASRPSGPCCRSATATSSTWPASRSWPTPTRSPACRTGAGWRSRSRRRSGRPAPAADTARAAVRRPRTASRRSTTRSATRPATSCCSRWPARLRGRLRRSDLLARLGGDEFLVALTGLDPAPAAAEARRVADELTAAVRAPVALRGRGRGGRREHRRRRLPGGRPGVRGPAARRRPRHVRAQGRGRHETLSQLAPSGNSTGNGGLPVPVSCAAAGAGWSGRRGRGR